MICPLNNQCTTDNIVYRSSIYSDNDFKFYFDSTENPSKFLFNRYCRQYKIEKKSNVLCFWQLNNCANTHGIT